VVDREVNLLQVEVVGAAGASDSPPLVVAGVAEMAAVGALGNDDDED